MLSRLFRLALQHCEPRQTRFNAGVASAELFHFLKRLDRPFVVPKLKAGVAEDRIRPAFLRLQCHQLLGVSARSNEIMIGKFGLREHRQPANILPGSHRGERGMRRVQRQRQMIFVARFADAPEIQFRQGIEGAGLFGIVPDSLEIKAKGCLGFFRRTPG